MSEPLPLIASELSSMALQKRPASGAPPENDSAFQIAFASLSESGKAVQVRPSGKADQAVNSEMADTDTTGVEGDFAPTFVLATLPPNTTSQTPGRAQDLGVSRFALLAPAALHKNESEAMPEGPMPDTRAGKNIAFETGDHHASTPPDTDNITAPAKPTLKTEIGSSPEVPPLPTATVEGAAPSPRHTSVEPHGMAPVRAGIRPSPLRQVPVAIPTTQNATPAANTPHITDAVPSASSSAAPLQQSTATGQNPTPQPATPDAETPIAPRATITPETEKAKAGQPIPLPRVTEMLPETSRTRLDQQVANAEGAAVQRELNKAASAQQAPSGPAPGAPGLTPTVATEPKEIKTFTTGTSSQPSDIMPDKSAGHPLDRPEPARHITPPNPQMGRSAGEAANVSFRLEAAENNKRAEPHIVRPAAAKTDLESAMPTPRGAKPKAVQPVAPPSTAAPIAPTEMAAAPPTLRFEVTPGTGIEAIELGQLPSSEPQQPLQTRSLPISVTNHQGAFLPRMADRVMEAVIRQDSSSQGPIELVLDPPELGRIRVIVGRGDEGLVLTLLADRPETLDLMRRHGSALSQEFHRHGLENGNFQFSGRDGSAHTAERRLPQDDEAGAAPTTQNQPPAPEAPPRIRADGRLGLDIRI